MQTSVEDIADNNIIEAIRMHARWQSPFELVETGGVILMAGESAFPGAFKNCAARTDGRTPASEVIAQAKRFFGEKGRGFTVFSQGSRDQDLEAQLRMEGFVQRMDTPCMLVSDPVSAPSLPQAIVLRPFDDVRQVRDAAAVSAQAYQAIGLDPAETLGYFASAQQLIGDDVIGCVAYENDQPLASAIGIRSDRAVGIYWVATLPAAQRRGLAGACTARITNQAFARGASLVTLQASAFGEPVYRRLGFSTYNRFKLFRHAPVTG